MPCRPRPRARWGSLAARRDSGSPSISPTTTSGFRRVASKPMMTLWQAALHRTSSTPGCARRNPSSASPCRSSTAGGSTRSRARPGMAWTRRARTTDGSPALIGPASVMRRVDSIGASLAPAAGSASPSLKRPSLHPLGRIGWLFARSHLLPRGSRFHLANEKARASPDGALLLHCGLTGPIQDPFRSVQRAQCEFFVKEATRRIGA